MSSSIVRCETTIKWLAAALASSSRCSSEAESFLFFPASEQPERERESETDDLDWTSLTHSLTHSPFHRFLHRLLLLLLREPKPRVPRMTSDSFMCKTRKSHAKGLRYKKCRTTKCSLPKEEEDEKDRVGKNNKNRTRFHPKNDGKFLTSSFSFLHPFFCSFNMYEKRERKTDRRTDGQTDTSHTHGTNKHEKLTAINESTNHRFVYLTFRWEKFRSYSFFFGSLSIFLSSSWQLRVCSCRRCLRHPLYRKRGKWCRSRRRRRRLGLCLRSYGHRCEICSNIVKLKLGVRGREALGRWELTRLLLQ